MAGPKKDSSITSHASASQARPLRSAQGRGGGGAGTSVALLKAAQAAEAQAAGWLQSVRCIGAGLQPCSVAVRLVCGVADAAHSRSGGSVLTNSPAAAIALCQTLHEAEATAVQLRSGVSGQAAGHSGREWRGGRASVSPTASNAAVTVRSVSSFISAVPGAAGRVPGGSVPAGRRYSRSLSVSGVMACIRDVGSAKEALQLPGSQLACCAMLSRPLIPSAHMDAHSIRRAHSGWRSRQRKADQHLLSKSARAPLCQLQLGPASPPRSNLELPGRQ